MPIEERQALNGLEMQAVLGVSRTTWSKYVRIPTFPPKDDRGCFVCYDVVRWHLLNKAQGKHRCVPKFQADELGDEEQTLADQEKILDLRLKSHKVALQTGQVCPPEDLRHVVGEFVATIREIWQAAPPDVSARIESAYERFMTALEREAERLQTIE